MKHTYDVVVIGGGQAGQSAALAASKKRRVVLIDEFGTGGENNYVSLMISGFAQAAAAGLDFDAALESARERRQQFLNLLPIKHQLQAAGIAVVTGHGLQTGPHTVTVGHDSFEASQIIIATSPKPQLDFAGSTNIKSLAALFSLKTQPNRLIFINADETYQQAAHACMQLGITTTLINTESNTALAQDTPVVTIGSIEKLQRSYRLNYLIKGEPHSLGAELIISPMA